jgi:hypothetical protein
VPRWALARCWTLLDGRREDRTSGPEDDGGPLVAAGCCRGGRLGAAGRLDWTAGRWWPMAPLWRRAGAECRRRGIDRASSAATQLSRLPPGLGTSRVCSPWASGKLVGPSLEPAREPHRAGSARLGSVASHEIRLGSGSFRLASRAGSRALSYFSSPSSSR